MLPAYSIEADVESGDIEAIPQNETLFQDEMKDTKKNNGRKRLTKVAEITLIEIAAATLALISVCTSIAAMFLTNSSIVNGAGVFALIIGPYSYWQQRNITDVKALKETHEALVKEVDQLSAENKRLRGVVDDLGGTVNNLEAVEDALDEMKDMNVNSVLEYKKQIGESRAILDVMKKNVKAKALQNVITVVLNSDIDGDYSLNTNEVDSLIQNLKSINGLQMNEQGFRKIIKQNDGSVNAVVKILKHIMNDTGGNINDIFKFDQ